MKQILILNDSERSFPPIQLFDAEASPAEEDNVITPGTSNFFFMPRKLTFNGSSKATKVESHEESQQHVTEEDDSSWQMTS